MEETQSECLQFLKKMDIRYKVIFLCTFLWGFLAHGMAFFHKFSAHDDLIFLFDVGYTYTSGRWFLGTLSKLVNVLLGSSHFSLPLFNGVFCLLCMALFCCVLVRLLDIRRVGSCVVLSGILVVFPMLANLFLFMFTAPYYMVSLLMAAVGALLVCRRNKWYAVVGGMALLTCSVGIYQAYIPVILSIFLIYFIHSVSTAAQWRWQDLLRQGIYYVAVTIGFVGAYFLITRAYLSFYNLELTGYVGISSMGQEGLGEYLKRILLIIYNRNIFTTVESWYAFPFRVRTCYHVLLALAGVLSLWLLLRVFRENKVKALSMAAAMALLPLAVHFIYVMCDVEDIHPLMVYGEVMFFVYFLWLGEHTVLPCIRWKKLPYRATVAMLAAAVILYARYDNAYYLRVQMEQRQTENYYNTLTTQIKSTEGYQDTLRVVYIHNEELSDETVKPIEGFAPITMGPHLTPGSNVWTEYMHYWCGFSPELADPADFENLPQVQQMPRYPDDGSIQIINDTVVVKF